MRKNFLISIQALSVVGIILALYLLYNFIFHPAFQPCRINQTINCDAITSGSVSTTLGIPTALYGLIGYIVIFFAALKRHFRLLLGMTTFGLLFCLRVTVIEVFQLNTLCPVCLGCQIIMLIVFLLALSLYLTRKGSV